MVHPNGMDRIYRKEYIRSISLLSLEILHISIMAQLNTAPRLALKSVQPPTEKPYKMRKQSLWALYIQVVST